MKKKAFFLALNPGSEADWLQTVVPDCCPGRHFASQTCVLFCFCMSRGVGLGDAEVKGRWGERHARAHGGERERESCRADSSFCTG